MSIQIPSLILPVITTRIPNPLADVEAVADLLTHISIDIPVEQLQEKTIHIWATEVLLAPGVPGPLWAWIELSQYPTSVSAAFWGAIGGGGGPSYPAVPAMAPVAPTLEIGLGINGVVHNILIPWAIHSPYARLVIQTPVAAALPMAFWVCQAYITSKGFAP